jgi:hypothetical protein
LGGGTRSDLEDNETNRRVAQLADDVLPLEKVVERVGSDHPVGQVRPAGARELCQVHHVVALDRVIRMSFATAGVRAKNHLKNRIHLSWFDILSTRLLRQVIFQNIGTKKVDFSRPPN